MTLTDLASSIPAAGLVDTARSDVPTRSAPLDGYGSLSSAVREGASTADACLVTRFRLSSTGQNSLAYPTFHLFNMSTGLTTWDACRSERNSLARILSNGDTVITKGFSYPF